MRITGGRLKGLRLSTPRGRGTRPMTERVRKALFDILSEKVLEARVLDLFSGSGALGIEALSRGAKEVIFVEADPRVCEVIRRNLSHCSLEEKARVIRGVLPRALSRVPPGPYDLIFLTPPYRSGLAAKVLQALSEAWLSPEGVLVVEEAREEEVTPPPGLRERDRRVYGQTVLYFYGRSRD